MFIIYIYALFFICAGALFCIVSKKISPVELLIGASAALVLAGAFHWISFTGRTADIENWSGQVTRAVYYPEWVEEYQQAHTREYACGQDSKGNTTYCTEVYYTTEYRTHYRYWEVETNINSTHEISQNDYNQIGKLFGNKMITERVYKSGFHKGDHNIYYYNNLTQEICPVTETRSWTNRLKAAPSVYSFIKVSEEQRRSMGLFDWPESEKWNQSGRLLGKCGFIDILEWDRMNAIIGPKKQANLILVGFPDDSGQEVAEYQRAYWSGGKKNDVVIIVGVAQNDTVSWCKSFGWAQDETVFADLDSYMLGKSLNNSILSGIKNIVEEKYTRKEWKDFNYISVEPPGWVYIVYPLILIFTQGGLYFFFHKNNF